MGRIGVVLVVALAGLTARAAEPVVEPPKLIERTEALFPDEAARAGLRSGVVVLELDLDDAGRVAGARVVAPAGHGFDGAALAIAPKLRFSPYRLDGKPLPAKVTFRVVFTLAAAPPPPPRPASAPPPPPEFRVRGLVRERGTRSPIPGATIIAVDSANQPLGQTESGAGGAFALPLPAGVLDITVVVAEPGHKVLRQHEHLGAHDAIDVRYTLARASYALYESTVRGAPPREEVARVSLGGDEVRMIPGTRGDTLAAVLNLPSVARSPLDLGQLVIRGSAPGESGAFLMGMAIPNAFHFGALTSTFNSYLLERFDLIPSNFSVRYGRYTGGIVDIVPREGRRDRFHADVKVDVYDAHLILEGPIGKGSFAVSARRSFVDAFVGAFTDPGTFTVAPRYYDYEGELDYPIAGGHFKLLVFGSDDDVSLVNKVPPDSDPTLAGTFSTRQWFHTVMASYRRKNGRWDWDVTLAAGPQHYDGNVFAAARFNLDLVEIDARAEARYHVSPRFLLTLGADVQTDYFWVSVDAPQQTTEEVPLGPLGERPRLTLNDHGFEGSPAVYVQGDLWILPMRLLLTPGLRVDKLSAYARVLFQPRIMARYHVGGTWWLKGGVGLFHQPQMAPTSDPVLGNPHLSPEQAWHFMLGFEARPIPQYRALLFDFNVFYKDIQHIATTSDAYTQRDGKAVPERYYDDGIGRVYGLDLLLKHDNGKRVFGWLAYTLLKSERRDHPGQPYRPFEYDQTNIFTLIGGYHFPLDIDAGIRFRYVTGNPVTPFEAGGIQDADQGVYIPIPKLPAYSERMPDFIQLDLRIDKRFIFKYWILGIYLDISNITNRGNVEGYAYSYDYTRKAAVTGLPIVPALGVRASF